MYVSSSASRIVFADPAALEQFNLRLQAFARNALEEQRLQKLMSRYRSAQAQTAR
ncbi:hypothetical protein [Lysobacter sp. FW306-1B-D06B]|uniref:hypothetical protein n=1 Tax=Lysobacter sp. FW306-1B-D06B TaxID=3140250 RepID=UPI0031402700